MAFVEVELEDGTKKRINSDLICSMKTSSADLEDTTLVTMADGSRVKIKTRTMPQLTP